MNEWSKNGGSSVQFSSVTQSCATLCDPMHCSMPGFPLHHQFPEINQTQVSIESVIPSNHLIPCRLLLFLPSIFPSISLFQWVSSSHQVAKVMEFHFSISLSNEYSGLISFRIDWLDLLAIQGTLKSLLQHHSSKASILQHSAFFIVQLSHPSIHGKTIAFTRWTFVESNVSAF